MYRSKDNLQKDMELADFADRLLSGGGEIPASTSDEELLGLEKTLLHLKESFPSQPIDEKKANRMLAQIKSRARREEPVRKSFFQRLFDLQSNSQIGLLVAVAAVVVLVIVGLPAPQTSTPPLSGTAFSGSTLVPVLGVMAVLFVLYWISRRK